MWSRAELKEKGKAAFKRNYWKSVLIAFVAVAVAGGGSASSSGSDMTSEEMAVAFQNISTDTGASIGMILGVLLGAIGIALIITFLWSYFVMAPVSLGAKRFFFVNAGENADIKELAFSFKKGRYFKVVKTYFARDIFIFLWSLLLIIPGIMKSYEYRMMPYLLAENPEMTTKECFTKSKEMMKGQKWNAFVLDLSFIGWAILTMVTCGVLGVFYVAPYIQATDAELYIALKEN